MPRTTRPTPDRARDVRNPLYIEAEDRVLAWLREQGKVVEDVRHEHKVYDFRIGNAWNLDVKADTRHADTGRVAWEQLVVSHDPNRLPQEGWGMHHALSYVAYVLVPPEGDRARPWPLVICHAGRLREAVMANRGLPEVKEFLVRGTDRDATGYAVDLNWLRSQGNVVLQEGEC